MEKLLVSTHSKKEREQALTMLYKNCFPLVAKQISRQGGSFEEAKDIFHDALIIYYEKALLNASLSVRQEKAYVLGIAKHLWSKRFQEKIRHTAQVAEAEHQPELPAEPMIVSEKLMQFLSTSGKKCMDLLRAFYYDQSSLEQIAHQFGFSGIRSATVQKFKCLTKVRDTIKEKTLNYEDFVD